MTMNRAMIPIGMFTRKTQRHPVIHRIWLAPAKSPPISGKGAVARLHEAIEVEREILSKAESVLGCLAIAMEYETNGPGKPYYPDVARIARDMVRGSINALDPLALKRLRDKVEEEVHRTYIPSTLCPLTLDYCVSF